ncbi:MAG: CRTAC1 family protein [Candidatus Eremiobacteraeota bacterium]|nr:CRTAC1 family protein [Candidatus Eremiobacteraeota bacterium]
MKRLLFWLCLSGFLLAEGRFSDVTATAGLSVAKDTGEKGSNPHAVAIEDFDGDGRPDVVILNFTSAPHAHYYENLGGLRFREASKGSGLEGFAGDGSGACVADFDRDGKLDVFLASLRGGASRLYKGHGDGTFTPVNGLKMAAPARSCAWSDVDGDGWLDLYVTSPEGRNYLFMNRSGTFRENAEAAGVALNPKNESLGCAFGDVDGDGRDDLFVTNYHSQVSALLKNVGGGRFRDITQEAGLGRRCSAVGCAFGDLFNRGLLDLYVSTDSWLSGANYSEAELRAQGETVEGNALYRNDGKGHFQKAEFPDFKSLSHDVTLEDLDQDGRAEIYVGVDAVSGNQWATSKGGNPLYSHGREVDWGTKEVANCVCVPAADLDGDGDLDLLLVNFYSNPRLLRNNTNGRNWLQVRAPMGSKVTLWTAGKRMGFRQIQSGSGYGRCSPLVAHFGLGAHPAAGYRVEVTLPGGRRVTRDGVAPGQKLSMP